MPLDRADLKDVGFVDAVELAATGARTSAYRTLVVVSITAGTQRVVVDPAELLTKNLDAPVEVGDLFTLAGATAGNGDYTVAALVTEQSFDVVEVPGGTGTGGTGAFYYPSGASKTGVDPTGRANFSGTTLQAALDQLDAAVGGITAAQHRALRQLIHFIDNGPAEGFASLAYREVTLSGVFPTAVVWYDDATKAKKIVEKLLTYTGVLPTTIAWKVYATDGTTVLATVSDAVTYAGVLETSRTRTIT